MFSRRPNVEVDAVLDDDLNELLDELNVRSQFYSGEYKCMVCSETITFENLKFILPRRDGVRFLCDKPSCMVEFAIEH